MWLGVRHGIAGFKVRYGTWSLEPCYVVGFPGYGAWVSRHGMVPGFLGVVYAWISRVWCLVSRGMLCGWVFMHDA